MRPETGWWQLCDLQHTRMVHPPPPWKEYCGCRMAVGWVLVLNDRPSGDRGATHRLIGKGGMIVRPSFCSSRQRGLGEGCIGSAECNEPVHITSRVHASVLPGVAVA